MLGKGQAAAIRELLPQARCVHAPSSWALFCTRPCPACDQSVRFRNGVDAPNLLTELASNRATENRSWGAPFGVVVQMLPGSAQGVQDEYHDHPDYGANSAAQRETHPSLPGHWGPPADFTARSIAPLHRYRQVGHQSLCRMPYDYLIARCSPFPPSWLQVHGASAPRMSAPALWASVAERTMGSTSRPLLCPSERHG